MITLKINLRQLKHALVKTPKGSDAIVIPIKENDLFQGEKGIYLDVVGFEIKNPQGDSKDTHLLKQSFPKDVYEKMTDEDKKAKPIIGNGRIMSNTQSEPEPQGGEVDMTLPDNMPF